MEEIKFLEEALNHANGAFTVRQSRDLANRLDSLANRISQLEQDNKRLNEALTAAEEKE